MKKITFCALALVAFGFTNAQTTVSQATQGVFPVEIFSEGRDTQVDCSEGIPSNAFENGIGDLNDGIEAADDFTVDANTILTISTITVNLINDNSFEEINVAIYANDGGFPGEMLFSDTLDVEEDEIIGEAFGREVHEIIVEPNDWELEADVDEDTVFWLGIETPNPINPNSDCFWETSNADGFANLVAARETGGAWSGTTNAVPAAVFSVQGDCVLSVDDNLLDSLSVYPNPATNQINIDTKGQFTVASAVVFDITGKRTTAALNGSTIDISALSSGFYLVEVTSENGAVGTYKIVKK